MCVYRSLEGEYDYQSWSVKGIPGIVRDKGILRSTKGLRKFGGEYGYQSWSVKGIPGIVRDKGILGSTKGLRKCVLEEAWSGNMIIKVCQ